MKTLAIALTLLGADSALAADTVLKPGPGAEATVAACSGCHTPAYIVMNSTFLTPDAWRAEVSKMRTAFGAPIDDATAAEIITYLAKNYAAVQKPDGLPGFTVPR